MECCQICFDTFDATVIATAFVNGQLCGPQCPAKLCCKCLLGHLRASLDDCYAGVLPRVRCPICLTRLNKSQWLKFVPDSSAIGGADAFIPARYYGFCQKACSFQSPCCHKVDYSHLPDYVSSGAEVAIDGVNESASVIKGADTVMTAFMSLCHEFCFHRVDGRTVIQFAIDNFTSNEPSAEPDASTSTSAAAKSVHELIEETLVRISDDERRATLLLSYLYLRPAALTRCCNRQFCFNCKRNGHHDTCDSEEIVVDKSLLQCRSCRVMIVKVEGCDSVTCMCGFAMGWSHELMIQMRNRKGLIAVDIFDRELYTKWVHWVSKTKGYFSQLIQDVVERRARKVKIWLATNRPVLRKPFARFVRWFRFSRRHDALQRELFWTVYTKRHAFEAKTQETDDDVMAELFAINLYDERNAVAA